MILVVALAAALLWQADSQPNIPDWLINTVDTPVEFTALGNNTFILTNGLISRTFTTVPDFGTINFYSYSSAQSIQRAIYPEGFITIDGVAYNISGISQASSFYGYMNATNNGLDFYSEGCWHYSYFTTSAPTATVPWTPGTRHSPDNVNWPPLGLHLQVHFTAPTNAPADHKTIDLVVHYEMYVGIPLVSKWVTAVQTNTTAGNCIIDTVSPEYLAVNHQFAPWDFSAIPQPWTYGPGTAGSNLYIETDQAHSTQLNWITDPHSTNDWGASEIIFSSTYSTGPGAFVSPNVSSTGLGLFTSFRTLELVTDSVDPERVALSRHRMTRLLAPWTMENPIFFHLTEIDSATFRNVVDQAAEVGFEMIIYSFGSGFVLETNNTEYLEQIKTEIAYAHSKGIEVGGYDLICLDRGYNGYGGNVGDQWDIQNSDGTLGADACFASGWVDELLGYINNFINITSLSMLETDGPYGGDLCAATNHSHHYNLGDSVYRQTQIQAQFYANLRAKNIFFNQPDMYFYQGGSKTGMGYNEDQYSLPRWQDITVSRQGMFDDTYHFIPTQGWMFVPLVDYHGGGAAAAFEPLSENILDYEWALAQYLGAGVAACYRGYEIYDTPQVQQMVTNWVSFYKKYRQILISDIIHIRRPDTQDYDSFMHVNPSLSTRALAMVFNPTSETISKSITLPLYYTGLSETALIQEQEGSPSLYVLDREYQVQVNINMPPMTITWFLVQDPGASTNSSK